MSNLKHQTLSELMVSKHSCQKYIDKLERNLRTEEEELELIKDSLENYVLSLEANENLLDMFLNDSNLMWMDGDGLTVDDRRSMISELKAGVDNCAKACDDAMKDVRSTKHKIHNQGVRMKWIMHYIEFRKKGK